jgi:hypothetical protein
MVARILEERGMLRRGTDGFARVVKIENRPTRVYVLTPEIMAGGRAHET